MKITREKRPDRVICKWKKYEVELDEDNKISISSDITAMYLPLSEIPNLIKALQEVSK